LRNAELDLNATSKARAILYKGGSKAYEKARRTLIPDSVIGGMKTLRMNPTRQQQKDSKNLSGNH